MSETEDEKDEKTGSVDPVLQSVLRKSASLQEKKH